MNVLDQFPGGAARGGDFISGMSTPRDDYEPVHQDSWGTMYRPERVIVLDVFLEDLALPEGQVCFLESSVQAMGQLIGLVPSTVVVNLQAELIETHARVAELEHQLAQLTLVDTVVESAVQKALGDLEPVVAEAVAKAKAEAIAKANAKEEAFRKPAAARTRKQ